MDDDTLAQLFGVDAYEPLASKHMPLRDRAVVLASAKGKSGFQIIEIDPVSRERTVVVDVDTKQRLPVNSGAGTINGKKAYFLKEATDRLRVYRSSKEDRDDSKMPAPMKQAEMLQIIYGTTYLLTDSVVSKMKDGNYVFMVGASNQPKMLSFSRKGPALEGAALQKISKAAHYFSKGKQPVFLLMAVTHRVSTA